MHGSRSRKRLRTVLAALVVILALMCLGVAYEQSIDCQIGRLVGLDTLGAMGLPSAHRMLERTYGLPVKEYALGIIEGIGDVSSIPVLIRQFGYRGRWWVRCWNYNEELAADSWRNTAAGAVKRFGPAAESYLRSSLSDPDKWVRYWSLVTLAELEGFEDWEMVRQLAAADQSDVVRAQARQILKNRTVAPGPV